MLRTKKIGRLLAGGIALVSVSVASAQTLLAPDGLHLTPAQTYTTPAPQMAPPPVFLPSGPTYPVETRPSVSPWATPQFSPPSSLSGSGSPQPNLVPQYQYDLHGFAPLPASDVPAYTPGMTSPSMSAWAPAQQAPAQATPVKPKHPSMESRPKTIQTIVPKSSNARARSVDVRTPSAARVWRAMGRLR